MSELEEIIHSTARSFRQGAPITIFDIRVAAAFDGHSLKGVHKTTIAECLRKICRVELGPLGEHDYRSYIVEVWS